METFTVDVAPPGPTRYTNITTEDLHTSPQLYFAGSDIVWMLISSALVLMMVPAMCLFYSGASNRRSSLTLFRLPLITAALIGFQWYLWGYSLAFTPAVKPPSPGVSWYGGDPRGVALHDSLARPVGADGAKIPELLYQFYEGMFASFTAALVCGGTIRDVRVGRFLVFITFWSLLVYNPVARWSWHWAGWSNQRDVMDFAGGTAVHITSGTAVLAFYIFYELDTKGFSTCWAGFWRIFMRHMKPFVILGLYRKNPGPPRRIVQPGEDHDDNSEEHELENRSSTSHQGPKKQVALHALADPEAALPPTDDQPAPLVRGLEDDDPPHNVNNMILGTALLWIGWFGFNGGSALGGNMRAVSACVSTHVAACAGGTTSLFFFWAWNAFARAVDRYLGEPGEQENKIPSVSVTQFCDGAVIGLVAITPAAGYVPVWSAGIFGVVSAIAVNLLKRYTKGLLKDDPLFVFSIHAGGGMVVLQLSDWTDIQQYQIVLLLEDFDIKCLTHLQGFFTLFSPLWQFCFA
ncbi:Rh-like protein/ammonium transporter [Hyaloscypha bicolor E]|uniref:Rh-like protein/ammonium transporter n=1 Tax=Hyaloscypha bicolor E TaxID=1095630 RepID=A0A2J6TJ27_9HELO|nr:Rh-like protein/ammonium transporter [Hyaloscypha bicolor E]PMD63003.1 Rh-like protein/ammonium transporter [Hyaloscypha bicolor E]